MRLLDKELIRETYDRYLVSLLTLNIPSLRNLIKLMPKSVAQQELDDVLKKLETTVKGVMGIPEDDEERWQPLQGYCPESRDLTSRFKLPAWTGVLSYLPKALPANLCAFVVNARTKRNDYLYSEEVLRQCALDVCNIYQTLCVLFDIKEMVSSTEELKLIKQWDTQPKTGGIFSLFTMLHDTARQVESKPSSVATTFAC